MLIFIAKTLGYRRALLCAFVLSQTLAAQVASKVDFARQIEPIFREQYVECHGPSQQMRGLRLDRRVDAMPNRVGANGARIVPGDSAKSPVYRRVSAAEASVRMPPNGPLSPQQVELIKAWIDQGAEWPEELPGRKAAPPDPIVLRMMTALRNGDRPAFLRLLRDNPKAAQARGLRGWTPLMYAALYGSAESVRSLLEKAADPNAQNDDGGTALMYAVDDVEKTRLLVGRGANPNLRSGQGRTALLIAVESPGSLPVVKLLLDQGADAGVRLSDGRGVLAAAIGSRDAALLRLLIEHGAEKKPVPLGPLLTMGCAECFDALLEFADARDLTGGLQAAVRAGDLRRIQTLLDRGARPGANLLQTVAMSPGIPIETIKTFIRGGADGNAKVSGLTMVEFAHRQGNAALVEALAASGIRGEAPTPPQPGKPAPSIRAAIEKTIPSLQRSDVAFLQKAGCVSCHNNSLTAMTIAAARARGVGFDQRIAQDQLRKIAAFLQENAERGLENDGIPGAVDTVSYILLGMAAEGYPADPITDVWARYIKNSQAPDGRWKCIAQRPPLESSDFEVTAASIRSLKAYGLKSRRQDYDQAVERGVRWLETTRPETTEDLAFQIRGLLWGGGKQEVIRSAASQLVARQGNDGGWRQLQSLPADAYATGQALVALHEARAVAADSPAFRRGIQFLLDSQREDGSWHVRTRSPAFQPQFDSEFPYGPDQFISAAASNWAVMALLTAMR